jgi:autotransporter-associated beta strand protein
MKTSIKQEHGCLAQFGVAPTIVAAILVTSALVRVQALADTTWQGDFSSSWHNGSNWTADAPDASDTAFFGTVVAGNSTTPSLFIPGVHQVGAITFLAGAPAFTITVERASNQGVTFEIVGAGITNNSGNTQSIVNQGDAGTDNAGRTIFRNNATAGNNVVITNLPAFVGSPGQTSFYDNSNAGGATIFNRADGPAGSPGGDLFFFDNSSASNATIHNLRGRGDTDTFFQDNSTAGNAQIINQGALEPSGFTEVGRGTTLFSGTSDAGTANITNEGGIGAGGGAGGSGGATGFSGSASASDATILNTAGTDGGGGGGLGFSGNSTAGDATITSNGAIGQNNGAGGVTFSGTSDAGTAMITANGGGSLGPGAFTSFKEKSSAANATLITNGGTFGGVGGLTLFTGNASGGEAIVITNAGGTFDISGLTTTGTTVGSISGGGSYSLGGKNLSVGAGLAGAFADTTVSGVLSGTGGSLTKTGIGALTLSGANTYSGGTSLEAGRLSVDNDAALGTGTLQIFGGILGSHIANTVISNNITVSGDFTISAPSGLFAQLELSGDVNLGAATHVIRPENSNFANFSGRLLGTTAGLSFISSDSVDGNFFLSGSADNAYGGTTTVQGNLINNGSIQLFLSKSGGAIAIPGNLTVNFGGEVTLLENEQIADTATVTLNFGGNLLVNGEVETITSLNGNGSVKLDDGSTGGILVVRVGDFNGVITDAGLGGRLVKPGPGTLFLSGANTYTGGTRVEGGNLAVDNPSGSATGTGAVTVQAGAVLSGGNAAGTAGFVAGAVIIENMGRLEPGLSAGTLTLQNNLTLSPFSQLDFELGMPGVEGGANNDLVKVFGNLTLDGELNISSIGFGGQGDYTLFTYASMLTDNGLAIGTTPAGFEPSQFTVDVSIPNKVILHVVPEPHSVVLLGAVLVLLSLRRAFSRCAGAKR